MRATPSLRHPAMKLGILVLTALIGGRGAAARADIEAAVQVTRDNHPGPLDPHNPGFAPNLEAAHRHGLALADRARDASGYMAALMGFNVRIGDGHAGVFPRIDDASLPPPRWLPQRCRFAHDGR